MLEADHTLGGRLPLLDPSELSSAQREMYERGVPFSRISRRSSLRRHG